MKKILSGFVLLALCGTAMAGQTVCQGAAESLVIRAVQWDTVTKKATLKDAFGGSFPGVVTAIRPHTNGFKTNLEFKYTGEVLKDRIIEVLVFPSDPGKYRLLGDLYTTVDGKRVLDIDGGNSVTNCVDF